MRTRANFARDNCAMRKTPGSADADDKNTAEPVSPEYISMAHTLHATERNLGQNYVDERVEADRHDAPPAPLPLPSARGKKEVGKGLKHGGNGE